MCTVERELAVRYEVDAVTQDEASPVGHRDLLPGQLDVRVSLIGRQGRDGTDGDCDSK
jgi:hypothetical protein